MNGGSDGKSWLIVSMLGIFIIFFFSPFFQPEIEQAAKRTLGLNIEQNGSRVSVAANAPESCAGFSNVLSLHCWCLVNALDTALTLLLGTHCSC